MVYFIKSFLISIKHNFILVVIIIISLFVIIQNYYNFLKHFIFVITF